MRFSITQIKQLIAGRAVSHWYEAVSGFRLIAPAPVACRLEHSTDAQPIAATPQLVLFDTTVYDTVGTLVDTFRTGLTAPVDGLYLCGGTLTIAGMSEGNFSLTLSVSLTR